MCSRSSGLTPGPSSSTIDFHYSTPGIVAIVGDNGSGKSTLAQLMAGWYPDYLPGDIDGT
ncbi:AAA family ATPase, partial [Salmonella enterica subsp. enterica serovar Montevideo]|nr:AAA family ATPase [Salmonella enterica subsp. enterica serovar Montevideo]